MTHSCFVRQIYKVELLEEKMYFLIQIRLFNVRVREILKSVKKRKEKKRVISLWQRW